MATAIQAHSATASKKVLWASRAIATPAPVVQAMDQLGYPLDVTVTIGIIELVLTALYVIPRTSIFGALLLTGYLGGAVGGAHARR